MITFPYSKPIYAKRTPIEVLDQVYSILEELGISKEETIVNGVEVLVEPVEVEKTGTKKLEYKAKIALMKWFGEKWLEKNHGRLIMPGEQSAIALKLNNINIFMNPTKEYNESKLAVLVVLRWRIGLSINGRNGLIEIDEWESTIVRNIKPLNKEEVIELVIDEAKKLDKVFREKNSKRKIVERAIDDLIEELVGEENEEEYQVEISEKEIHYNVKVKSSYYELHFIVNKYSGKVTLNKRRIRIDKLEELLSDILGTTIESLNIVNTESPEITHVVASTPGGLYKVLVGDEGIIEIRKYRTLREIIEKIKEETSRRGLRGIELDVSKWSIESEKPLQMLVELSGIGVNVKALIDVEENRVLSMDIDVNEEAVKKLLESNGLRVTSIRRAGSSFVAAATDGIRNYVYLVEYPLIPQLRRVELSRRYALEQSLKLLARLGFTKPKLRNIEDDGNGGWVISWIIGAVNISIHAGIDGRVRVTGYNYDSKIIENLIDYVLKYNGIRSYNILRLKNTSARYAEALVSSSKGILRFRIDLEQLSIKPA